MKRSPCRIPPRRLAFCRTRLKVQLLIVTAVFNALSSFAPAAMAQTTSALKDLVQGREAPNTIKASQMTSEWRRFTAGSGDASAAVLSMIGGGGSMVSKGVYYTRGETLRAADETYLVAYAEALEGDELERRMRERAELLQDDDIVEIANKLDPNSELTLCLLNLRTSGSLSDIRAFDPKNDLLPDLSDQKNADQVARKSTGNLKQLALGMMQYMQDYDERLPPMRSAQSMAEILNDSKKPGYKAGGSTVQQALIPYLKNATFFAHPTNRQLYRPNLRLTHIELARISAPTQIVLFYEATPDATGRRAVAYLDGHVKRELEANWPKILKLSDSLTPKPLPAWKVITKPPVRGKANTRPSPPLKPPPGSPVRPRRGFVY
jgi:hypothetical protein